MKFFGLLEPVYFPFVVPQNTVSVVTCVSMLFHGSYLKAVCGSQMNSKTTIQEKGKQ